MSPPLSPRVLLVENDDDIRDLLGESLGEEGFLVTTASNGREALEMLRSSPRPAVILLDLMMPVMHGWDFRAEQLNDPALRDIPVVVVSAAGLSADTIRRQLGSVGFFSKPVPYFELLETLRRICRPTSSTA